MNEQVWWYLSRSSGIVAMVLLVMSVVCGVLLSTRAMRHLDRPAWLLELHGWFGGTALAMTALHLLGLALDGYVDFGLADLLVPGVSEYRPVAVAIGVVTLYALVAVQLTAVLRRRLPTRLWRGVHVLSYALVWGALIHAGAAGSDTVNRGYQVLALVLTMLVVAATILRIVSPGRGTHATPADRATVGPGSHP